MLKAYGDQKTMAKVATSGKYQINLKALHDGILDAANRNGIDVDQVIKGAKRHVLSGYYSDFFKALNDGNQSKLEEIADHVMRINGSAEGAKRAMKYRFQGSKSALTPDLSGQIHEAFGDKPKTPVVTNDESL